MLQPTPTPVPDHGTEWGLLFLLVDLYGFVALLGAGTVVAVALCAFDRPVPKPLQYLLVAGLVGALALAGFVLLVAATDGRFDAVALLLFIVFLPLALSVSRRRGTGSGRLDTLAHAAMAWSIPALVGFGVVAFGGTRAHWLSPAMAGVLAVVIVVAGTIGIEHLPFFPETEQPPE